MREVADGVNVDPVDASVAAGPDSLTVVKAAERTQAPRQPARRTAHLPARQGQGLIARLVAKVNVTKPAVTTKPRSPSKYPTYLTLDRSTYQLKLWKNLELVEDLHGRGRPGRARDPGRCLLDPEQAGRSGLDRAEFRLGR